MHLINPFWTGGGGGAGGGVTWNPADMDSVAGGSPILSNGNLTFANAQSQAAGVRCTASRNSGKYYFEIVADSVSIANNSPRIGLATGSAILTDGIGAGQWTIQSSPAFYWDQGSPIASGIGLSAASVVMVAVDFSSGSIWFGVNGTWILSGNPAAGTNASATDITGLTLFPYAQISICQVTANFASAGFAYTVPAGFSAWDS